MSSHPLAIALKARWILPIIAPPIDGGVITISGERIVSVGENLSSRPAIDLGDVVILPGLVNAHTHLEFSDLASPLGAPGEPLPAWIRRLIVHRRGRSSDVRDTLALGLDESLASGVTAIGEIATSPWQPDLQPSSEVTVFQELIGLAAERIGPCLAAAEEHLKADWSHRHERPGLSPHAPYTVHSELLAGLAKLSSERQIPLAMHLAESREELELLQSATGPLREMLEDLGAWAPDAIRRGARPLDYLRTLAEAHRSLVIHGNYLDAEEIEFLTAKRDRMAVVYCPRTHAYFGHEPYPLAAMLQSGVNVALGTDSRASNPDLSLLGEVRFLAERDRNVAPRVLLELATLGGARALGLEHELGSLEPGKLANLAVIALPSENPGDPFELVACSPLPVVATWWRGKSTTGNW